MLLRDTSPQRLEKERKREAEKTRERGREGEREKGWGITKRESEIERDREECAQTESLNQ